MTTLEILSGLFTAFVIAGLLVALSVFVYSVTVTAKTRLMARIERKMRLHTGKVS